MDIEHLKKSSLYIGSVSNASILNSLGNAPKRGELAYCEKESQMYIYDNGWQPHNVEKANQTIMEMNLYDLNKSIIEQLGAISYEDIDEKIYKVINNYFIERKDYNYFMLLGKEISYFTVFHRTNRKNPEFKNLGEGVFECLKNVGDIYSVEENDSNAIEIWVNTDVIGMTVLYLFPYDTGVCTIGG